MHSSCPSCSPQVARITPRLVALDILCVGDRPVQQRYSGVIRLQDVRATEIDKVAGASGMHTGGLGPGPERSWSGAGAGRLGCG